MSPDELTRYRPKSVAEEIAIEQVKNARGYGVEQQSLAAAKEITDRTEGKAPQTVNLNGNLANAETTRLIIEQAITALVGLSAAAGVALSQEKARSRIQELQRSTQPLQLNPGEGRR